MAGSNLYIRLLATKMNKIELPEFKRYEEEADFWDNLDTADFMLEDDEWFHFDTGKRSPLRAALLSPEVQYPMPARDLAHQAVKHALEKDGWTITHDPLFLSFAQVEMYVDLGAEQLIVADRNG